MVNKDNRRFESTTSPANRLKLEGLPINIEKLVLDNKLDIEFINDLALINGVPCSREKIISLIEKFKEL